ncbi:MAG: hypothetical protein ACK4HE_08985 [Chitinophagaceae bacterium]
MLRFNELQIGDYVFAEFEGVRTKGEVVALNTDDKQVCIENDVQPFWYTPEHIYPIPLNDTSLKQLIFFRERYEDGDIEYKKGAFRLHIHKLGDYEHVDMWYREDRRHNPKVRFIHQLQNQYHQMTKVYLTDAAMQ